MGIHFVKLERTDPWWSSKLLDTHRMSLVRITLASVTIKWGLSFLGLWEVNTLKKSFHFKTFCLMTEILVNLLSTLWNSLNETQLNCFKIVCVYKTHATSLILCKRRILTCQKVSYQSQYLPVGLIEKLVSVAQDGAALLEFAVSPVTTHLKDPEAAHPRWGTFSDADPG